MSRWIHRSVLTVAAIALGSCEGTSPKTRAATKIVITPGAPAVSEKGSLQFVAVVYDQDDKPRADLHAPRSIPTFRRWRRSRRGPRAHGLRTPAPSP